MPAFELWVCTTSGFKPSERRAQAAVGFPVRPGPDGRTSSGTTSTSEFAARGEVEEIAFGPFGRAGDQGDFIVITMMQLVDRQQRILLAPPRINRVMT